MGRSGNVVSDEEILEVLENSDELILKTSEISEKIALDQQRTGQRLQHLMDEGRVFGKQIGRGYVWWHPETEGRFRKSAEEWS